MFYKCLSISVNVIVVVGVADIPARIAALARSQLDHTASAAVRTVVAVVWSETVSPSRLAVFFGLDLGINLSSHLRSSIRDQTAFCHPGCLLGRGDGGHKFSGLLGKGLAHLLASRTLSRVGSSG